MNLEMIFKLLISILSTTITVYVIPLIRQKVEKDKIEKTMSMVEIAVRAAEQIYTESGQGEKRKNYVLYKLKELGIDINKKELDIMIESAVHDINLWKNQLIE